MTTWLAAQWKPSQPWEFPFAADPLAYVLHLVSEQRTNVESLVRQLPLPQAVDSRARNPPNCPPGPQVNECFGAGPSFQGPGAVAMVCGLKTQPQPIEDFVHIERNVALYPSRRLEAPVHFDLLAVMDGHGGPVFPRLCQLFWAPLLRYSFYYCSPAEEAADPVSVAERLLRKLEVAVEMMCGLMDHALDLCSERLPVVRASGLVFTLALVFHRHALIANLGDCRAYLIEERSADDPKKWRRPRVHFPRAVHRFHGSPRAKYDRRTYISPHSPPVSGFPTFAVRRLTRDHDPSDLSEVHRIQWIAKQNPSACTLATGSPASHSVSLQEHLRRLRESGIACLDLRYFQSLKPPPAGGHYRCKLPTHHDFEELAEADFDASSCVPLITPTRLCGTIAVTRALGDFAVLGQHGKPCKLFIGSQPEITLVDWDDDNDDDDDDDDSDDNHDDGNRDEFACRSDDKKPKKKKLGLLALLLTSDGTLILERHNQKDNGTVAQQLAKRCDLILGPWAADYRQSRRQARLQCRLRTLRSSKSREERVVEEESLLAKIRLAQEAQIYHPVDSVTSNGRSADGNPQEQQAAQFSDAAQALVESWLWCFDRQGNLLSNPWFDDCSLLLVPLNLPRS